MLALPVGFSHKATVGLCFVLWLHCSTDGDNIDLACPQGWGGSQVGLGLCAAVIGGHSPHSSEISCWRPFRLYHLLANAAVSTIYTTVTRLSAPVSCGSYGPG
jgi:hypothetical protein